MDCNAAMKTLLTKSGLKSGLLCNNSQASHENVAHQLKDKLGESKEEFERIQDEIKFFQEAVLVQTDPTLCNTSQVPSASASERTGSRSSVEQVSNLVPLSHSAL